MWYKNAIRRHLCDMHIDDWDEAFLSEFSPEVYLENLKKAKIQNAMLYFQSHVGLCYYPTKSGKMHNAFVGREDMMQCLAAMCRKENIYVTGYYSLIYNNWAYHNHPEWRMIDKDGTTKYEKKEIVQAEFANNNLFRYGLCCPNNKDYRNFISEQMREMAEYFEFDGMFFDMLFWPHMCYCESCRKRWEEEVGREIPVNEDWNDERWLLHIRKRREWMGEFAQGITDEMKKLAPGVSVEHNFACAVLSDGSLAIAEPVNDACDYVGGDLYGGIYRHSFTCKLYRNITKNQPFEYMFSRCEVNLSKHTLTKSEDVMRSAVFLTSAHHGATMVIDAVDPTGTMDKRVYERVGKIFAEEIPYEKYFCGDMIEDIGVYYTMRSKFNNYGEIYSNHLSAVNTVDTFVFENIPCGVTGGFHDIEKYKILIAPCLTNEDSYDNQRIIDYVKNGGCLYISGGQNEGLMREFFCAECNGRTTENIVYIAPEKSAEKAFCDYNEKYPLQFEGTAPIMHGFDENDVLATITLPYTNQNTLKFVSIHSNPPFTHTDIVAAAVKKYGKGTVLWSALPIESINLYEYRRVFLSLLKYAFGYESTVVSDAPKDVEIISFKTDDSILVSTVLLNEDYKARKLESFYIAIKADKPCDVLLLPEEKSIPFKYEDGFVKFESEKNEIFNMYKIIKGRK